ncbi:MAG TPA: LamG domain-containing protein [Cyclobacteriaceae bacterium]|nr:LamG domain-containing protein [Cyclobacteriaceae bacterium]
MKTKKLKVLLSALMVMLLAWTINSCSKSDVAPVNFTSLTDAITTATTLLNGAVEGTATGDYTRGSKATLAAAITAAQAVVDNKASTSQQVTAAVAQLAAAVSTFQAAAVVPIDPTNLAGQWTFDELTSAAAGTSVKDYSGNSFNGKITAGHPYFSTTPGLPWSGYTVTTNLPTQTADRYGDANKALHFTAGANVEIPYNAALNPQQMSISLWAKADSLPGDPAKYWANNYMISMNRWNGYKFQIQDTPRPFFTAHASGVNTPPLGNSSDSTYYDRDMNVGKITTLSKWHHYVVTFGGGHEVFYVDGFLVYDWNNVPGTIVNLSAKPVNLVIGQDLPTGKYSTDSNSPYYVNYGAYFIGAIDEVRVYKSILSATQVTSIYNLEKP